VADNRSGLLPLIFSRGVSAFEYVTSKVITSALGQMCFIGITLVVFFVALLPFFPMGTIYIGAQRYSEALLTMSLLHTVFSLRCFLWLPRWLSMELHC